MGADIAEHGKITPRAQLLLQRAGELQRDNRYDAVGDLVALLVTLCGKELCSHIFGNDGDASLARDILLPFLRQFTGHFHRIGKRFKPRLRLVRKIQVCKRFLDLVAHCLNLLVESVDLAVDTRKLRRGLLFFPGCLEVLCSGVFQNAALFHEFLHRLVQLLQALVRLRLDCASTLVEGFSQVLEFALCSGKLAARFLKFVLSKCVCERIDLPVRRVDLLADFPDLLVSLGTGSVAVLCLDQRGKVFEPCLFAPKLRFHGGKNAEIRIEFRSLAFDALRDGVQVGQHIRNVRVDAGVLAHELSELALPVIKLFLKLVKLPLSVLLTDKPAFDLRVELLDLLHEVIDISGGVRSVLRVLRLTVDLPLFRLRTAFPDLLCRPLCGLLHRDELPLRRQLFQDRLRLHCLCGFKRQILIRYEKV